MDRMSGIHILTTKQNAVFSSEYVYTLQVLEQIKKH